MKSFFSLFPLDFKKYMLPTNNHPSPDLTSYEKDIICKSKRYLYTALSGNINEISMTL